jgi:predicted  nucleic acid-binding Zn-ribbon protein
MNGDGFIDLRLNRQEGQIHESFWPSFTDIMTVIVMIFLIAMVVLLMRNMELVRELRNTMDAQEAAMELARTTGEQKESLALQLHSARDQLSQLQLEVLRLRERSASQAEMLTERNRQITDLNQERDSLRQQTAQLTLDRQRLQTDLDSRDLELADARQDIASLKQNALGLEQKIAGMQHNFDNLQLRFEDRQRQLNQLQETLVEQQTELAQRREQGQELERKYLVLVGERDELQTKYEKLIKPARSSTGRYLVEVRYWKEKGKPRITYRAGGTGEFEPVTKAEMDKRLTALAESKVNGLYIRVIFPEESGLSYNEAWEFTSYVHNNYDYYYQESPPPPAEPVEEPSASSAE